MLLIRSRAQHHAGRTDPTMQAMNRLAFTTNLLRANSVAADATSETKTAPPAQIDMSTIRQPVRRPPLDAVASTPPSVCPGCAKHSRVYA